MVQHSGQPPRIAILFSQFAPYHVDRIEAAAERLQHRAQVLGIEVATTSQTYAWEPSGDLRRADKLTLFPGSRYEQIGGVAKLRRAWSGCRRMDCVFVGVPYSEGWIVTLSWLLRIAGVRVVLMTESKADDFVRRPWREWVKRQLLRAYNAALVGGPRQVAYVQSLGFAHRPVATGYDTVSIARVRSLVAAEAAPDWTERPFLYVGRFVDKKNLFTLLHAYSRYVVRCPGKPRCLVMVGDGPLRAALQACAENHGIAHLVVWSGFRSARGVAEALHDALALLLPSTVEQWGLVVNEAVALGIPTIVSQAVGAGGVLVEHGTSGWIVDGTNPDTIADAMRDMERDETRWNAMRMRANALAGRGDVWHFAKAVEKLIAPDADGG